MTNIIPEPPFTSAPSHSVKRIEKAIKAFVRESYGPCEVSNPSWDIKELAQAIAQNTGAGQMHRALTTLVWLEAVPHDSEMMMEILEAIAAGRGDEPEDLEQYRASIMEAAI